MKKLSALFIVGALIFLSDSVSAKNVRIKLSHVTKVVVKKLSRISSEGSPSPATFVIGDQENGSTIVFRNCEAGKDDVCMYELEGKEERQLYTVYSQELIRWHVMVTYEVIINGRKDLGHTLDEFVQ